MSDVDGQDSLVIDENIGSDEQYDTGEDEESVAELPDVRPVRERHTPVWHKDYEVNASFALNAQSYVENIPESLSKLKEKNKTWTLTKLPEGRSVVSCK